MLQLTRHYLLEIIDANPTGGYFDLGAPIAEVAKEAKFPMTETRRLLKDLETSGDIIFVAGDRVKRL
jgi:hypothetical protein